MISIKRTFRKGIRLFENRAFLPNTLIGRRYEIMKQIGEGNYGVVYLCTDRVSGGPVVLKRADPLKSGKSRAKHYFDRETGFLERLDHPAIPRLYDRFQYRGHHCFTMEYVRGESLESLLFEKNRIFTEENALTLVLKLLDVIRYIHEKGVVHRDISIANVLVHRDRIRLIDFGLARDRETDPMTNDFHDVGHLLLYLLYSTYEEPADGEECTKSGWEEELSIHPRTRTLIRRLLGADTPYRSAAEAAGDADRALAQLLEDRFRR